MSSEQIICEADSEKRFIQSRVKFNRYDGFYIAGIFRQWRIYPHSLLTSELDASSWGMRSGARETSFTSHFEIGLHIFGVVNHTK